MKASSESNLKVVTLELGGKSPCVIFDDADVDQATKWASIGILYVFRPVYSNRTLIIFFELVSTWVRILSIDFDIILSGYKGQSCVAGSRIFVQEGIYDEFLKKFTATAAHLASKTGDPFDQGTEHGPQVSQVQFDVCPWSMDCTFV